MDHHPSHPRPQRRRTALIILSAILVILAGAALRAASPVIIPVMFAVFITLAVRPMDAALQARLPDGLSWLGRAAVLAVLLLLTFLFVGGLAYVVQQVVAKAPNLTDEVNAMMSSAGSGTAPDGDAQPNTTGLLQQARALIIGPDGSLGTSVIDAVKGIATMIAEAMGAVLASTILIFFLVLLALGEAGTWMRKSDTLTDDCQRFDWHGTIDKLGETLRQFLLVRAGVGVLSAALYTAWLALFGLDLLLVWAILVLLMNFIPNIGSIISGIFPTLYAFVTLDFTTAFILGAGLFVIEQVIGNVLDPKLQARRVALSPLVILIAVVFWGWLWGIAGAFLATPMTLSIMIVCAGIPSLKPVALLLSNRKTYRDLDAQIGEAAA